MLWNNFAGDLFEIPELANFSGWMVAEDLDAAVWFLVAGKEHFRWQGNHEGVWCWGALLTEVALGRMIAEDLFRNADNPPCGGHG